MQLHKWAIIFSCRNKFSASNLSTTDGSHYVTKRPVSCPILPGQAHISCSSIFQCNQVLVWTLGRRRVCPHFICLLCLALQALWSAASYSCKPLYLFNLVDSEFQVGYSVPAWSKWHFQTNQISQFWMKSGRHDWSGMLSTRTTQGQSIASLLTVPKHLSDFTFMCPYHTLMLTHTTTFKKSEIWELLQSPSFRHAPCFKVTVTPVLSSSLLQPVISINLSLHSDWQVASSLLYTSSSPIPQLCLGRWLYIITSASLYFPFSHSSSLCLLAFSSPHPVVLTLKAQEWCKDLTAG